MKKLTEKQIKNHMLRLELEHTEARREADKILEAMRVCGLRELANKLSQIINNDLRIKAASMRYLIVTGNVPE